MRKAIGVALTALSIATVGVSGAQAGSDEVRVEGPCSGRSEWEFRLIPRDNNTLRVRWRVDSQIPGQTWQMSIARNGTTLASATRVTNRDGEAELRLNGVQNQPGTDNFTGTASNAATGETCNGAASI
jgi:hypothetical protein